MQHETVKEKDNVVLNNKLDLTFWSEDKGRYACLNTIKQRLREQFGIWNIEEKDFLERSNAWDGHPEMQ